MSLFDKLKQSMADRNVNDYLTLKDGKIIHVETGATPLA